jgi:hypothetical protein
VKSSLSRPARLAAFALLTAAAALVRADDPNPPDVAALIKQLSVESPRDAMAAAGTLDALLRAGDKAAEETAAKVLDAKEQFVKNQDVLSLLKNEVTEKRPELAARIVLAVVRSQKMVAQFKKGSAVVGQIVVEDGKTDVEDVLAQMPILPQGYFVGEVGDLKRPIGFRSPGYSNLDVPLEGKSGDLVYVGKSVLKPLEKDEAATLKGTIALDGEKSAEGATVTLTMSVPTPNTPHNGYSPRSHWPKGVTIPVSKTGEFVASGLSPADYFLNITADGHVEHSGSVSLKAGEEKDAGAIRLFSSDIGFYIGKAAPKAEKLTWEKDYAAALARAKEEKKPIFIMETATWCGWCKKLEKETLDDPWVEHMLSGYILVQAFEDKEVEDKYGSDGYPTLVFTDSAGKMAHKFVGYRQIMPFLEELAQADQKLGVPLPEELVTLADKKIIAIGARPVAHAKEPDRNDAELKWAKGVAEDFLAAMQSGDDSQARQLMNKEMGALVDADITWFNIRRNTSIALDRSATFLEEMMSPDKDEASFRGRLEGANSNRQPMQSRFTLRVAKDKESGKWRVAFFTFSEPALVEKKP